jgi:hypothetical protein
MHVAGIGPRARRRADEFPATRQSYPWANRPSDDRRFETTEGGLTDGCDGEAPGLLAG